MAATTGYTNATMTSAATAATSSTVTLDPNALNYFITVPNDPLTAARLATPYLLRLPCSMAIASQQAFAEAVIYGPATVP